MTQADSEDGLAAHQAADVIDCVGAGLGIAGAVGEEDSVRLQGQNVFGSGLRGDYRYLTAFAAQFAQDVLLDAVVVGDYVETRRLVFDADDFIGEVRALARFPDVSIFRANYFGQVLAVHFWDSPRFGDEFLRVGFKR